MSARVHVWGAVVLGTATLGCGSASDSTAGSPTPASVVVAQGDHQGALPGRSLPQELRVVVKDQSGNPVPGVTVTWVVTAGGGSVSGSGPTGGTGLASTSWTLGPDGGLNTLEARVAGIGPALFSAIGVSPQTAIAIEAWLTVNRSPTEILLMSPDGKGSVNLTAHPADDGEPAWSPDRSRIAFKSDRDGSVALDYDIYVMNSDGSGVIRLTTAQGRDVQAEWSPDGSRIAFASLRDGNFEIYVMNPDGSNQVRLTNSSWDDVNPDWSPDGTKILFSTQRYGDYEIAVMNADGTGVTRLTNDPKDDFEPVWSPDGARIAFATDRFSSVSEVAVMNANGSGVTRLAAHPGNLNDYGPSWSPDGAKIAYTCWRGRGGETFSEVCSMNADGSGEVRLTVSIPWASWAAWQR